MHPCPERIRSYTEELATSSGMDPILSDPIPKLLHPPPACIRSYPIRYRSLYPFFRNGSDPIRSDIGAYPSSTGMNPILSDQVPELVHYLSVWNRSNPTQHRSLYVLYPNSSDPIRPDTGAYTSLYGMDPIRYRRFGNLSGMDPILSEPIPKLLHPLPAWIRSYRIRHRSLYPFFRNGSDPIRSDTGACASSTVMNPILSDPVPELIPYIAVWNRSDPIRHRSLYILYPNSSDPLRPDTGAYTSLSGMDPIRSNIFDNLFRNGSDPIRSDTEASTSSPGMDPILSDPIPELTPLLPESIRPDPIRSRSLSILCRA